MDDEAQGLDTGTGYTVFQELKLILSNLQNSGVILTMEGEEPETDSSSEIEYEAPTSFKEALNPTPKAQGSDLSTSFLKGLPPEDAEKLAPYVKNWDAGVTKLLQQKSEEFNSKLSAYEGIDPTEAREALELRAAIAANPAGAVDHIREAYNLGNISAETANELIEEATSDDEEDILDQLPPEIRDRLLKTDKLEEAVKTLLDREEAVRAAQQEAKEVAEFSKQLDDLKTKYGDYDRDTVLRLIASEMEPEDAVKHYHALIESAAQQKLKAHNDAPPVLGNGHIPPVDNTPVHKLSAKDRQRAVLQYLNQGS
jgi:hypothetical protein